MKKRFLVLLMAVLLLFFMFPLSGYADSTPLLYHVTDDNGHEIYLFGTIHVGNASVYPLSDAVMEAFSASDALAVEVDLLSAMENPEELLTLMDSMYCKNGEKATDELDEGLLNAAADALNMDARMLNTFKPYGILSMLEEKSLTDALLNTDDGVDFYLLEKAREMEKPVIQLESIAVQQALLDSMSADFIAYQIEMYVDYPQQSALSTLLLLNAWKTGDRAALQYMLNSDEVYGLDEALAAEIAAFNQKMYGDRDDAFTLQAQAFLEKGEKVFFAVGAAHVAGENGIADQLQAMGYTVEEIGR